MLTILLSLWSCSLGHGCIASQQLCMSSAGSSMMNMMMVTMVRSSDSLWDPLVVIFKFTKTVFTWLFLQWSVQYIQIHSIWYNLQICLTYLFSAPFKIVSTQLWRLHYSDNKELTTFATCGLCSQLNRKPRSATSNGNSRQQGFIIVLEIMGES